MDLDKIVSVRPHSDLSPNAATRKLEARSQSLNLTVAITGASGAILGRGLLRALEADDRVARVHFVASENSLRVLAEELGVTGRTISWKNCSTPRQPKPLNMPTPISALPSPAAAIHPTE